jgi:transposase
MPWLTTMSMDSLLKSSPIDVVGLSDTGRVVLREKLTREQLHRLFATHPACVMATETCCGSQDMGRIAANHRYHVRLIPAQHVRPFAQRGRIYKRETLSPQTEEGVAQVERTIEKSIDQTAFGAIGRPMVDARPGN